MGVWVEVIREIRPERMKRTPSPRMITCAIAKNEGAVPPKARTATHRAPTKPTSSNRTMEGSRWFSHSLFVREVSGDWL